MKHSFHAEDMVLSYRALLIACADGNVQVASQLHDVSTNTKFWMIIYIDAFKYICAYK
jgi:predicted ATP-grasp superfamily ATP-dependent carboligase